MNCLRTTIINMSYYDVLKYKVKIKDLNIMCGKEPLLLLCCSYSLSARILHLAPSGPKFSNSENCCGSENAMPPKIFWDMEGHRGHFTSKNVFFFKKHILEKIHNKSHYVLNF